MKLSTLIEQIDTEARDLRPLRVLLTLVSAPFFAAGWLAGQAVRVAWLLGAWAWTACVVGFRQARGS